MKTRVLFVTPEIAPWQKTGGLGDFSAALPEALLRAGVDITVLVPAYPAFSDGFADATPVADIPPLGALPAATLLSARTEASLPLLLLDSPSCYARPGNPYQSQQGVDWADNHLRFGLLSRAAALIASKDSPLSQRAQIVHCNDWQTGLCPAYLHYLHGDGVATVMTVHNLAFQGIFPAPALAELGLPPAALTIDGLEFYGQVSCLKAGLQFADQITTVSPNYAREIQQPVLGFGLDGLLSARSADLTGILNGVDAHWNPTTDPYLKRRYDARSLLYKEVNRRSLRSELHLADEATTPLLAMVSRLTEQKGVDLVIASAEEMLRRDGDIAAQLVVLGSGEKRLAMALQDLAQRHPGRVAAIIGFDERHAHRIEAGADIFLMPSRFEPCGLNQLYSLRYGTPPVVRATGGLADTVVDCTPANLRAGTANGFVFEAAEPQALLAAVRRATAAFGNRRQWRRLQRTGMAADFSWDKAATQYLAVYDQALRHHTRSP